MHQFRPFRRPRIAQDRFYLILKGLVPCLGFPRLAHPLAALESIKSIRECGQLCFNPLNSRFPLDAPDGPSKASNDPLEHISKHYTTLATC